MSSNELLDTLLTQYLALPEDLAALAFLSEHQADLLTQAAVAALESRLAAVAAEGRPQARARLDLLRSLTALAELPPEERLWMQFRSLANSAQMLAFVMQTTAAELDLVEQRAETLLSAKIDADERAAVQERLDGLRQAREQAAAHPLPEPVEGNLIEGNLIELLLAWIQTDTWEASQAFLTAHAAELLTEEATAALQMLVAANPGRPELATHATLLTRSRELGLEAVYAELRQAQALGAALTPLLGAASEAELTARIRQLDSAQYEAAIQALQAALAQTTGEQARQLRGFLAAVRQARQISPLEQAVADLVAAPDDEAARALLLARQGLLLTAAGRRALLNLAAPDPAAQARLAARQALWEEVYQEAHGAPPPAGSSSPHTDLAAGQTLAGPSQPVYTILNASHCAIGDGALTINHVNIQVRVPLRWTRPLDRQPSLTEQAVGRETELAELRRRLAAEHAAAIVGRRSTAIQGEPGIGKSTLAALYVERWADDYPGGVIWLDVGPTVVTEEAARQKLQAVAVRAYAGDLQAYPLLAGVSLDSSAVRKLLEAQIAPPERLLVVLDNVWDKRVVPTLRDAFPANAHFILTTRQRPVAREFNPRPFELDVLTPADARRLLAQAVPDLPPDLADTLAARLGYHAQALDVAAAALYDLDDPSAYADAVADIARRVAAGSGLGDLAQYSPDDAPNVVQVAIDYSYAHLGQLDQRNDTRLQVCFRQLGAFALEADFTAEAAGAVWQEDAPAPILRRLRSLALLRPAAGKQPGGRARWEQHAILRAYALRRQTPLEKLDTAGRHAAWYLAQMRAADDAQTYYRLAPDLPNLRHAFAWAIEQDFDLAQALLGNTANLLRSQNLGLEYLTWAEQITALARATDQNLGRALGSYGNALQAAATLAHGADRAGWLQAALAAYDEALTLRRDVPLDYATTQNNRAVLLSALAGLPGEDRAGRLQAALAAYDEALTFLRDVPLDYATTQNNRANLLRDLAGLPGEDRAGRLKAALAACDEALTLRRDVPLDYAQTQNNRAVLLRDLAGLPGEDRAGRLQAALAAYDEALTFLRDVPLDYATTQNNRALLMHDLAGLPGEDRAGRLQAALAAYDEALTLRRDVPLDYATTQNNRANLLRDLAGLPGEDRAGRLQAALAAYDEALTLRRDVPLDYATTQNNRAVLLSDLAGLPGEDRAGRLKAALAAYDEALTFLGDMPLAYATTQNNRAALLRDLAGLPGEDRAGRLQAALAAYEEALTLRRDVPLDYAQTQNNRAVLLSDLAGLPGEDRAGRLKAALAAYDEALTLRRDVPLDYAQTQNNRANLLSDLAGLPGEDRAGRLKAALAAYDEALTFLRDVPLAYAQTQNNRANLLSDLAGLPGEDRAGRLKAALAAYDEALTLRRDVPLDYAQTQNNRAVLLRDLAGLPGEDRAGRLKAALLDCLQARQTFLDRQQAVYYSVNDHVLAGLVVTLGAPAFRALWAETFPDLPLPELSPQLLFEVWARAEGITSDEELRQRLLDDADLQPRLADLLSLASPAAMEAAMPQLQASIQLLLAWLQTEDWAASEHYLRDHADELLNDEAEAALQSLIQSNPDRPELTLHAALLRQARREGIEAAYLALQAAQVAAVDPLVVALNALLTQVVDDDSWERVLAQHPILTELPALIRLADLVAEWQRVAGADVWLRPLALLAALLSLYVETHTENIDRDEQAQIVALLQYLLPLAAESGQGALVNQLRQSLVWALNTLGNACAGAGQHREAIAAYSEALAQAEVALILRNRAGERIAVGDLADAQSDIARAEALEPAAGRLPELKRLLAEAQQGGRNA